MRPDDQTGQENESLREATRRMRSLTVTAERIAELARTMHFAVLDVLPDEYRPPRSWEVEREQLMRRMESGDA